MTSWPTWPTSPPYLILHKVRGKPAFDIAVKMEVECESDPGPWWMIPTSGHRAYPLKAWELSDLADTSDINDDGWHDRPADYVDQLGSDRFAHDHGQFSDLPDHYENDKTTTAGGPVVAVADIL